MKRFDVVIILHNYDFEINLVDTSLYKINAVTKVESTSDTGNAIHTPNSPYHKGNIKIRGIKKNPCRDNVNNKAGTAFPTAWK
jgi:hypothetical protein